MFENPGARTAGDLAGLARGIGLEPAELRQALEEHAFADKVRASQGEARAAGIRGTPTLFLDGRMLTHTDYAEDALEFTLEDEEEWHAHQGWTRD
jgi:predicted DsbA family dithiol-disulfide isomerase